MKQDIFKEPNFDGFGQFGWRVTTPPCANCGVSMMQAFPYGPRTSVVTCAFCGVAFPPFKVPAKP